MKKWFLDLLNTWMWEDTIGLVILMFSIIVGFISVKAFNSDHIVRYYYLKGDLENGLVISGDIDWAEDKEIQLDRSITYEGAIQMVKDLNATLKNVSQ